MKNDQLVDHLFRHQYGKMVAILTRIFGFSHLQTIEDAVQDTFLNASKSWRKQRPDNPEAWLTQAAKNRVIDIIRKLKAEETRISKLERGAVALQINDFFLDHEMEDSQLRMIFAACHPSLSPSDQICFALKTISGFSLSEIASALLTKEETIKKRFARARKKIKEIGLELELPSSVEIQERLQSVHEIIYLIFNEGFHSGKREILIRKDLCGEAMRLMQLILKKEIYRTGAGYSLFALMCFHAARLESKIDKNGNIINFENQDRNLWYRPLIRYGKDSLSAASNYKDISTYHYEASIALVHVTSENFEQTNWAMIADLYDLRYQISPSDYVLLNNAIVHLRMEKLKEAKRMLDTIDESSLEQRKYLFYGAMAEYYKMKGDVNESIKYIDKALDTVKNDAEREYLTQKKLRFIEDKM